MHRIIWILCDLVQIFIARVGGRSTLSIGTECLKVDSMCLVCFPTGPDSFPSSKACHKTFPWFPWSWVSLSSTLICYDLIPWTQFSIILIYFSDWRLGGWIDTQVWFNYHLILLQAFLSYFCHHFFSVFFFSNCVNRYLFCHFCHEYTWIEHYGLQGISTCSLI